MTRAANQNRRSLESLTQLYRAARRCGCYANGTLKIGKVRCNGWEFVERNADGTLVVRTSDSETLHRITPYAA